MTYCEECLSKQQEINNLEEEIDSLKTKLRYQERTAKEGFLGSSTSSAKIPVKPNSGIATVSKSRIAKKNMPVNVIYAPNCDRFSLTIGDMC